MSAITTIAGPGIIGGLNLEETRLLIALFERNVSWATASDPALRASYIAATPAVRETALVLVKDGTDPLTALERAEAL